MNGSPVQVADPFDLASQVGGLQARQHFAGGGLAAETGGQVEGAAPVSALHRHRLSGVDADADHEREGGIGDSLIHEAGLEVDRGPDGLTRGAEHGQGLVAPKFYDLSPAGLDPVPSDRGEPGREFRGRLVAAFLGEQGVAPHVGDQERADDHRLVGCVRLPGRLLRTSSRPSDFLARTVWTFAQREPPVPGSK